MTEEEYVRLRENPFIVHFSGSEKPWDYICPDPRKEVFYDVLQHTDWVDYEPPLPELERKVGKTMGKYLRAARRWWRGGEFGAADQ
jgi:lipopolysaccharide biosynthesis glycosyltransferase